LPSNQVIPKPLTHSGLQLCRGVPAFPDAQEVIHGK
jgi:hypothetical protein